MLVVLASGCATTLDIKASPIRTLTVAREDGRSTMCPGETVSMRVDVEGREGGTRSTASSEETTALTWSSVELESPSGTLRASQAGAFQADTDVLRVFRDGFSVRASLRERPDVTVEQRFDVAYGCLLKQSHTAASLVVTFRYIESSQPRHLLVRLADAQETGADADDPGRYIVIDTTQGDAFRVDVAAGAQVPLVVPR